MEYRPQKKAKFPSIEAGKSIEDVRRAHQDAVPRQGQGRRVPARHARRRRCVYSGEGRPRHRALDRRRGSGDAVGLRLGARARSRRGTPSASRKCSTACSVDRRAAARPAGARPRREPLPRGRRCRRSRPTSCMLKAAKDAQEASSRRTPGASLVDLGDGVLCLEFHSKMNAIGADTVPMMMAGVKEAEQNFQALVVGNDAQQLLGRRQPDAAAARGAGRQLGRRRPDDPRVPERHDGAALRERAGGGGARRA